MIVGSYSLHLYCDSDKKAMLHATDKEHEIGEFPHQFTGPTRNECVQQANENGWTFKSDDTVLCPKCKEKENVTEA